MGVEYRLMHRPLVLAVCFALFALVQPVRAQEPDPPDDPIVARACSRSPTTSRRRIRPARRT